MFQGANQYGVAKSDIKILLLEGNAKIEDSNCHSFSKIDKSIIPNEALIPLFRPKIALFLDSNKKDSVILTPTVSLRAQQDGKTIACA